MNTAAAYKCNDTAALPTATRLRVVISIGYAANDDIYDTRQISKTQNGSTIGIAQLHPDTDLPHPNPPPAGEGTNVALCAAQTLNRRTQENHYLDAAALLVNNSIKSITYTYSTLGRMTGYSSTSSLPSANSVATYTYDTRQLRQTGQTGQSVNYGTFSLATSTTYNTLGQMKTLSYPDGAQYSYTYDTNKQLSSVYLPTGYGSITFNSYTWTVPAQITLPGGTVRNQQYDGLLRLKDLNVKDPGQSQVMSYQYNYDLTSNITTKATDAGTTSYGYDTLDHLTSATYSGSTQTNETYTYDGIANRLTDTKTAAATWVYDANNQLTSAGTISYTYDANGNTTNQTDTNNPANTRNYIYDTDNRLIEVRNASNALIAAYSYDPFGRRLSKDAGTSKTYYFYNEEGLIAEADASGQLTKSYGYAPGSTYSTNPLWLKSGAAYYTYQNDHLGTPMKLLSQSGAVVWSASYDAFGKATVNLASSITNNLRFPGQYFDAETGLHNNWMRYYDPSTGRYVTSDPIGLDGGINTYTYVNGNPASRIDANGLIGIVGSAGGQVSGMFGPLGGSFGVGMNIDTSGRVCKYIQICGRLGFGFYAGFGASTGLGVSFGNGDPSPSWSVGVGGDVGAGASIGGQITIGPDGIGGSGGRLSPGIGAGLSAGVDGCFNVPFDCEQPFCKVK